MPLFRSSFFSPNHEVFLFLLLSEINIVLMNLRILVFHSPLDGQGEWKWTWWADGYTRMPAYLSSILRIVEGERDNNCQMIYRAPKHRSQFKAYFYLFFLSSPARRRYIIAQKTAHWVYTSICSIFILRSWLLERHFLHYRLTIEVVYVKCSMSNLPAPVVSLKEQHRVRGFREGERFIYSLKQ